jgi:cold shock protein
MKSGTVKWFNTRKGYGYIKPGDGGFDVYVHISAVERAGLVDLKEGQEIYFDIAVDQRTGEAFVQTLGVPVGRLQEPDDSAAEPDGKPSVLSLAKIWARQGAPRSAGRDRE